MRGAWVGASSITALALLFVLAWSFPASPATASGGTSGAAPFDQPWASNNTGGVAAVFASPFPEVMLVQNANASVAASLQVDGIVELAAGASDHPRAVAVALPLSVSHFNGTPPGNAPRPWSFNLSATLAVYPTDLGLWNGTPATPPTPLGAPFGDSTLEVEYTVAAEQSGTGIVNLTWSVSGWPWTSSTDVLALESHFAMTPSSELWACSGTSSLTEAACPGEQVPVESSGSILWNTGLVGLEEDNLSGPTASVAWSPTLSLAGSVAGSARVTSGIDVVNPGSVEVVLGGVGDGASAVSGAMSLALSSGVAPPAVIPPGIGLVTAPPVVYGASAAAFAVFAGVGVWWYRRRDAKARDEF